jgi:uncharacterized small protein (DUF1192 family)
MELRLGDVRKYEERVTLLTSEIDRLNVALRASREEIEGWK